MMRTRFLRRPSRSPGLRGSVVEISALTVAPEPLLRRSDRAAAIIVGCLARAQTRHGMKIHFAVYRRDRYHLLLEPEGRPELEAFMRTLNVDLARRLGSLLGWPRRRWPRGFSTVGLDEGARSRRLGALACIAVEGAVFSTFADGRVADNL